MNLKQIHPIVFKHITINPVDRIDKFAIFIYNLFIYNDILYRYEEVFNADLKYSFMLKRYNNFFWKYFYF